MMSSPLSPPAVVRQHFDTQAAVVQVKQLHEDIIGKEKAATKKAIQAGKILLQLKKNTKHGDWMPLLEKAAIKPSTAQNYMNLAKFPNVGNLEGLPITEAYAKVREERDRQSGRDTKQAYRKIYARVDKAAEKVAELAQAVSDHKDYFADGDPKKALDFIRNGRLIMSRIETWARKELAKTERGKAEFARRKEGK